MGKNEMKKVWQEILYKLTTKNEFPTDNTVYMGATNSDITPGTVFDISEYLFGLKQRQVSMRNIQTLFNSAQS